jgi:hypothetical protein
MLDHGMENMTMNVLSQILQVIGFLFSLVVLVLLWRKVLCPSEIRPIWILLASAWTSGMLGTIAWIVHDLVTGTELDTFSVIDLFYIARYVLLGCALWLYPAPLPRRAGFWIGSTMLVAGVVVWAVYFDPAMALRGGDWTGFLGLALYPVFDAGIIALAWLRVRVTQGFAWGRTAFLLFCAMASYGVANTINLTEYVFSLTGGTLQNVFWIGADVFMLFIVWRPDSQKENRSLTRNQE